MPDINYKDLLAKYMAHVYGMEGSEFLPHESDYIISGVVFTKEEIIELNEISENAKHQNKLSA